MLNNTGGAGDDKRLYKNTNNQNVMKTRLNISNDTSSFGGDTLNGMYEVLISQGVVGAAEQKFIIYFVTHSSL